MTMAIKGNGYLFHAPTGCIGKYFYEGKECSFIKLFNTSRGQRVFVMLDNGIGLMLLPNLFVEYSIWE